MKRLMLRAEGTKEYKDDVDEPDSGWYDGFEGLDELRKQLIECHEPVTEKGTQIVELQALLRKGYGDNHDPTVYVLGQSQVDHADVPDKTLQEAGNIFAHLKTAPVSNSMHAGIPMS